MWIFFSRAVYCLSAFQNTTKFHNFLIGPMIYWYKHNITFTKPGSMFVRFWITRYFLIPDISIIKKKFVSVIVGNNLNIFIDQLKNGYIQNPKMSSAKKMGIFREFSFCHTMPVFENSDKHQCDSLHNYNSPSLIIRHNTQQIHHLL